MIRKSGICMKTGQAQTLLVTLGVFRQGPAERHLDCNV
jgi:hypothetical protein